MNARDLKKFRKLLLAKREEILQQQNEILEKTKDEKDHYESIYNSHLADGASDTHQLELSYYFQSRQNKILRHLDEALARIKNGEYGYCIGCGSPIPKRRLEIVPHTRHCLNCKSHPNRSLSV